jgi:hypothetical protein
MLSHHDEVMGSNLGTGFRADMGQLFLRSYSLGSFKDHMRGKIKTGCTERGGRGLRLQGQRAVG